MWGGLVCSRCCPGPCALPAPPFSPSHASRGAGRDATQGRPAPIPGLGSSPHPFVPACAGFPAGARVSSSLSPTVPSRGAPPLLYYIEGGGQLPLLTLARRHDSLLYRVGLCS